jgi:hypothetical protein
MLIAITLQIVDIEDKIKKAPDSSYEIGVFIGSMLPFVALVVIAFLIYRRYKNKLKNK